MVNYKELDPSLHADPLSYALQRTGMQSASWLVALGAVFSMTAVLLVFQYGQPRIFYAMGRDGLLPKWAARVSKRSHVPYATTLITGVFVALWSLIGDAGETYDLTNIGTLFAFALVSIGVLVLRHTQPERPRPFRVPFVWPVCLGGAAACLFVMKGLPRQAWERFGWWLLIGLVLYFAYGYRNSTLRRERSDVPANS
jgi:APA family basic amino acid/polyamine antiporter